MGINVIGFEGKATPKPRVNFEQPNGGPQFIGRMDTVLPISLQPGQSFVLPSGQYSVMSGRYTDVQMYDQTTYRWRNISTQPGQSTVISSDGQNFRLANTTGTPIAAVISNMGAGNATNGYNTVGVTPSGGNSTWGTLVGGTLNTTVTVTSGGNFALPPILIWQPAANQNIPYIPPEFCCNISANAINTITVNYPGAGLNAAGTLTAVNVPGDTNPGGASLTLNATLTNSGNLTAIWPLTQGTEVTSLPSVTFNIGGGMCANVLMDWTCGNYTVGFSGANLGVSREVMIVTANGVGKHTQNSGLTGNSYAVFVAMPRMAWLTNVSDATGNFNSNTNTVVIDRGKNLQVVPQLAAIPSNMNGISTNSLPVLTAQVGGVTDTSYVIAL